LPLLSHLNNSLFGKPDAGIDMTFHFGQLVAHAAKTRPLGAGCIIGSGTISNKLGDGPGKPVEEGGVGYSCIAEIRTIETINDGKPSTSFMKFGDRIRIEMNDANGERRFDLRYDRSGRREIRGSIEGNQRVDQALQLLALIRSLPSTYSAEPERARSQDRIRFACAGRFRTPGRSVPGKEPADARAIP
jgi:hypothetical protein